MLVAGLIGGLVVGLTVMYAGWRLVRSLGGPTTSDVAPNKDGKETDQDS